MAARPDLLEGKHTGWNWELSLEHSAKPKSRFFLLPAWDLGQQAVPYVSTPKEWNKLTNSQGCYAQWINVLTYIILRPLLDPKGLHNHGKGLLNRLDAGQGLFWEIEKEDINKNREASFTFSSLLD